MKRDLVEEDLVGLAEMVGESSEVGAAWVPGLAAH
jgi:hypothetical protein